MIKGAFKIKVKIGINLRNKLLLCWITQFVDTEEEDWRKYTDKKEDRNERNYSRKRLKSREFRKSDINWEEGWWCGKSKIIE